jgi:peptide/nickel transport system substrate-binding protein
MSNPPIDRRRFLGLAAAGTAAFTGSSFLSDSIAQAQGSGGTLTIAIPTNPLTLDPFNLLNHDAMVASQQIYENLVETDLDGNLRPQLAKALPTISADRKSYIFDLREDVTFQNGQKMTAEDVKYSFDFLLNPANRAARRTVFTRISRVTALSPYRVQFDLSEPYAPWLYYLTKMMGIFPAGSRETYNADYFKQTPIGVGTGVGIFEDWKPNDSLVFRRNPNHWRRDLPKWDRLVIRIIPEDSVRVAYLLTGQADIISAPPPRDFSRLRTLPALAGASRQTLGGWCVFWVNTIKPPFDDANFRKAVSCAMDRQTMADRIYYGLLEPSAMPAPASGWWFDKPSSDAVSFNLDKAREFLARSKYPRGAEFDLLLPSDVYLLDVKDAAVVAQAQLARIGIKVNLKPLELPVFASQIFGGTHTAAMQVSMSPGEPTFLVSSAFTANQGLSKTTGYTNPEVDSLLQQAYLDDDQARLKPIYQRLQQVMAEEMPAIWLGFVKASNLWRPSVRGFTVNQGVTITVRETTVA